MEQYFFAYLSELADECGGGEVKLGRTYGACQFFLEVSLTCLMFLSHGESCAWCSAAFDLIASFGDAVAKLALRGAA